MTSMTNPATLWPVAVFAHNESSNIVPCLDSLLANRIPGHEMQVHVLINGCTDDTLAVVQQYAASHPGIVAHDIQVGDKANAWNVYLHELAPDCDVHFFIDGDVQAAAGALAILAKALKEAPQANAAAAFPTAGRGIEATRADMLAGRHLAGNLYALSGDFARRIRELAVYMPVGFIGEDSLIGALAKWNLDSSQGSWSDARIVPCPDAGFFFESLSLQKSADWKLYWGRRIRYSIRHIQLMLYRQEVRKNGLMNTPKHVLGLYQQLDALPAPSWKGADALFGRLAMRRIRRQIEQQARR